MFPVAHAAECFKETFLGRGDCHCLLPVRILTFEVVSDPIFFPQNYRNLKHETKMFAIQQLAETNRTNMCAAV